MRAFWSFPAIQIVQNPRHVANNWLREEEGGKPNTCPEKMVKTTVLKDHSFEFNMVGCEC